MSDPRDMVDVELARKIREFRASLTPQELALWDTGTRFLKENPGFTLITNDNEPGDYRQDD